MLYNPRKHPEWLEPHSLQWYQQLGDSQKAYLYPCSFTKTEIEIIETIEYLHEPTDVIRYGCFGQSLNLISVAEKEGLTNIKRIFEKEAGRKGLSITHSRYMIRVEL